MQERDELYHEPKQFYADFESDKSQDALKFTLHTFIFRLKSRLAVHSPSSILLPSCVLLYPIILDSLDNGHSELSNENRSSRAFFDEFPSSGYLIAAEETTLKSCTRK